MHKNIVYKNNFMNNNSQNTNAFLIHISAFAGYLFPFGSIITPLILWQTLKDKSPFLDRQGKEAVNFNLSFNLYIFLLSASFFPFFFRNLFHFFEGLDHLDFGTNTGFELFGFLGIISIVGLVVLLKIALIILAALKAKEGEEYTYPLTIKFIK